MPKSDSKLQKPTEKVQETPEVLAKSPKNALKQASLLLVRAPLLLSWTSTGILLCVTQLSLDLRARQVNFSSRYRTISVTLFVRSLIVLWSQMGFG